MDGFSGGHEVVFVIGRRAGSGFFGGDRSDPGAKRQYFTGCYGVMPSCGPALIASGNQNKTV